MTETNNTKEDHWIMVREALNSNDFGMPSFEQALRELNLLIMNDDFYEAFFLNEFLPSVIVILLNKKVQTDADGALDTIENVLTQLLCVYFQKDLNAPNLFNSVLKLFDPSKNIY